MIISNCLDGLLTLEIINMVTSLLISVVTVSGHNGVIFQKVFVNEPDSARSCARRYEEANERNFRLYDWSITVRDY